MKKVPCEVYSRVVGYFRPVDQWNPAKQEEFKERKTFLCPSLGDMDKQKETEL